MQMESERTFDKTAITLSDIVSKGFALKEYVSSHPSYYENYSRYSPDLSVIENLSSLLNEKGSSIIIHVFGAEWCPDCRRYVSHLAKVIDALKEKGTDKIIAYMHGNIKVKPRWDRKEGVPIWKVPPSPPEVEDLRFSMFHIPAFFIFTEDGTCVGKIDEKPQHTDSMEKELLYYLKTI